jgi:hypothetical protein
MKIKIKEVMQEENIIKIIFENISDLEKQDVLDFYKEGNIYFRLRNDLGIIYGMNFMGNILIITTLNKHSKEVLKEIKEYFE